AAPTPQRAAARVGGASDAAATCRHAYRGAEPLGPLSRRRGPKQPHGASWVAQSSDCRRKQGPGQPLSILGRRALPFDSKEETERGVDRLHGQAADAPKHHGPRRQSLASCHRLEKNLPPNIVAQSAPGGYLPSPRLALGRRLRPNAKLFREQHTRLCLLNQT